MRKCGECQYCCEMLKIVDLGKPSEQRCPNQTTRGCAIYKTRPEVCREFVCGWLAGALPKPLRPDKVGALVKRDLVDVPGHTAKVQMMNVSFQAGRNVDHNVMRWVVLASAKMPVFVYHNDVMHVFQGGKPIYSGPVSVRVKIDYDRKGKITGIVAAPG